ncbi:hypothetical protein H7J08_23085 [Mycobacterium frederiksbergense]|nr:hypothetical protein [Mycolicibacterium frederiksbergense]
MAYRLAEFSEVIAAFTTGAIDPTPMIDPTLGLDRPPKPWSWCAPGSEWASASACGRVDHR